MNTIGELLEQMNSCFSNSKSMFWIGISLLTLVGAVLLAAGGRYFKRLLFVIGAVPTYLAVNMLAGKLAWFEGTAIWFALGFGLAMVLLAWLYIYTFGFWATVIPVGLIIYTAVDVANLTAMQCAGIFWMLATFGVAGGCVALIKQRYLIVPATAITGAVCFVLGVCAMFGGANPQIFGSASLTSFMCTIGAIMVVLAAAGIFVQFKYTAKVPTKLVTVDGEQVEVAKKSKACYILLGLAFGGLGVHNVYAGRYIKGGIQMAIAAFAGFFYFIPLLVTCGWALGNIFCASKNLAVGVETAKSEN